jgi:hypothetical protein
MLMVVVMSCVVMSFVVVVVVSVGMVMMVMLMVVGIVLVHAVASYGSFFLTAAAFVVLGSATAAAGFFTSLVQHIFIYQISHHISSNNQ